MQAILNIGIKSYKLFCNISPNKYQLVQIIHNSFYDIHYVYHIGHGCENMMPTRLILASSCLSMVLQIS